MIPDAYRDLIDGPVVVAFTTVSSSNQPQTLPVWCSYDGEYVLINSARGRQKDRNIVNNPFVTVLAVDPTNPYRYMEIRGAVEVVTEEGAVDHIDQLAKLYTGKTPYYGGVAPAERAEHETRVIYKIRPERVITSG